MKKEGAALAHRGELSCGQSSRRIQPKRTRAALCSSPMKESPCRGTARPDATAVPSRTEPPPSKDRLTCVKPFNRPPSPRWPPGVHRRYSGGSTHGRPSICTFGWRAVLHVVSPFSRAAEISLLAHVADRRAQFDLCRSQKPRPLRAPFRSAHAVQLQRFR